MLVFSASAGAGVQSQTATLVPAAVKSPVAVTRRRDEEAEEAPEEAGHGALSRRRRRSPRSRPPVRSPRRFPRRSTSRLQRPRRQPGLARLVRHLGDRLRDARLVRAPRRQGRPAVQPDVHVLADPPRRTAADGGGSRPSDGALRSERRRATTRWRTTRTRPTDFVSQPNAVRACQRRQLQDRRLRSRSSRTRTRRAPATPGSQRCSRSRSPTASRSRSACRVRPGFTM